MRNGFDPAGALVQVEPITLPTGVMMHDFNITADVRWFDVEPGYVVHPFNSHDDGWGMLLAYDPDQDRSELRIINGQDWSGEPAARIFTRQWVPYGAHGNWMPST